MVEKNMERANRVTVTSTPSGGLIATYYRTHKRLTQVKSTDTAWKADESVGITAQRESFRTWVQEHANDYGVIWNPTQQAQAWERKHSKYYTDEQILEDATTMLNAEIPRMLKAVGEDATMDEITLDGIYASDGDRPYCTKGKYDKDGAWAWAECKFAIRLTVNGNQIEITQTMQIASGQLKKLRLTVAEIKQMVSDELGITEDTEQTA